MLVWWNWYTQQTMDNCYSTIPLDELLVNPSFRQSNKIRRRLLRDGVKHHKCECCQLELWLMKPIPLELSHKDGNKHNCLLENLELLCPNCHALTPSYRGKNINSYIMRSAGV